MFVVAVFCVGLYTDVSQSVNVKYTVLTTSHRAFTVCMHLELYQAFILIK